MKWILPGATSVVCAAFAVGCYVGWKTTIAAFRFAESKR